MTFAKSRFPPFRNVLIFPQSWEQCMLLKLVAVSLVALTHPLHDEWFHKTGDGGQGGSASSPTILQCNVPGACQIDRKTIGGAGGDGGNVSGHDDGAGPESRPAAAQPRYARVRANVSNGIHNIRSGPGPRHDLVASVPAGDTVLFMGNCSVPPESKTRTQWCQVNWKGKSGWSSMSGLMLLR